MKTQAYNLRMMIGPDYNFFLFVRYASDGNLLSQYEGVGRSCYVVCLGTYCTQIGCRTFICK